MKITKLLIGIDDDKHAEHAAEYGFDIAKKFGAAVGLVNIVEPVTIPDTTGSVDPLMVTPAQDIASEMEIMNIQKEGALTLVESFIKRYAAEGLKVSQFVNYGSTADGIIECAREFGADLIVIGTHSRTGLDRLFMGSVAEHVVRHSEVPVLVVPMKSESQ